MPTPITVSRDAVVRLWLHRQGLSGPRGATSLSQLAFIDHLERTGGLQVDPIDVVGRAHYLTLWSRFGSYDPRRVDDWTYRNPVAYDYWGHEASILPLSHLPFGLRRMRRFPPARWREAAWWDHYRVSTTVKRRVLRRIRRDGPLESSDFGRRVGEPTGTPGGGLTLPKEDKRALQLLWHAGRVAVCGRRHFRRVYDLAERVYPADVAPAPSAAWEESWLLIGLHGNGVASERHLANYWTAPALKAAARKQVIARTLKRGRIVEVRVAGLRGPCYALAEHLDTLADVPEATGTTLVCPFDSLLWQRQRAEDLLGFKYRIEIYVPQARRQYGYYVLPILHDGRLVGRLDPKLHRDRQVLVVNALHLEPGFEPDASFAAGLREALASLGTFLGASDLEVPPGWSRKLA